MGTAEGVVEKFAPLGVERGGEFFLPLGHATPFVEECSAAGVAVIGIDFVSIEGDSVLPATPVNSADWSSFLRIGDWEVVVSQCNSASLRALEHEARQNPDQFCTFVLYDRSAWLADR